MSTFSNILPAADSISPPNNGEGLNQPAAAGGIAAVFADLVAQAMASGSPPSNEDVPASQKDAGTAGKSTEKAGESAKAQKNPPPQTGQPSIHPGLAEVPINQMIAATISLANLLPIPAPKLQLDPASVAPKRPTPGEGPAVSGAAAQSKQISGTFANRPASILSVNELAADAEPSAAAASNPVIKKSGEAEDEGQAISLDASANVLQAKAAANSTEDQSVNQSDSSGAAATESPPDFNGISIAKQDLSVKQVEKTNNIAGQTEKVLPGSAGIAMQAGSRLPVSFHSEQIASTVPVASGASENPIATSASAVQSVPIVSAPNTSVVERMQDMVTLNAVRLSDSGNNSMQVVIKPDSGTQLSLELRQHGSSVEVQAALQQGDFHHLNQQWPELQQRLGQRGIQLASLTDNANAADGGAGQSFQQRQHPTTEAIGESHSAATPATQIVPAITQVPVIEPARAGRGWETWA